MAVNRPWSWPKLRDELRHTIAGTQALARWHHPERGMIAPADVLPAIEQASLLERFAEIIMRHAFTALQS
jgi:EAL domain-containing protein (putative c-di-GMP-specific phosphodiesterase class I)